MNFAPSPVATVTDVVEPSAMDAPVADWFGARKLLPHSTFF
jgi:hypothetical protein